MHAIGNLIVAAFALPDFLHAFRKPQLALDVTYCASLPFPACSDWPSLLIVAMHIYHMLGFNLSADDYFRKPQHGAAPHCPTHAPEALGRKRVFMYFLTSLAHLAASSLSLSLSLSLSPFSTETACGLDAGRFFDRLHV